MLVSASASQTVPSTVADTPTECGADARQHGPVHASRIAAAHLIPVVARELFFGKWEMMEKPKISGFDAEHINQNAPPGRPAPSPEPLAGGMSFGGWAVDEWCSRWKICRGTYYALKRKGRGPPVVRIGNRDRITPAADAEWQAANDGAAA
jgi:hypothetical protein